MKADGGMVGDLEWSDRYLTKDEMKAWQSETEAKSHPRGEDVVFPMMRKTRVNARMATDESDGSEDDDSSRSERNRKSAGIIP